MEVYWYSMFILYVVFSLFNNVYHVSGNRRADYRALLRICYQSSAHKAYECKPGAVLVLVLFKTS